MTDLEDRLVVSATDPAPPPSCSHPWRAEPRFSLTLLGTWELAVDGAPTAVTLNGQRLLALLALRGPLPRAYAAGILWPDVFDEQAAARLRTTLWRLRQVGTGVLASDPRRLALSGEVVVDATQAAADARALLEGRLPPGDIGDIAVAMANTPELLRGWYDDWVIVERERLTQRHLIALESLADQMLAKGDPAKALQVGMAAVQLDPLRESAHRAVIRAHLAAGNPGLARRQYDRYRDVMRQEFGMEHASAQMRDTIAALMDV